MTLKLIGVLSVFKIEHVSYSLNRINTFFPKKKYKYKLISKIENTMYYLYKKTSTALTIELCLLTEG